MVSNFNPDVWAEQATQAALLGEHDFAHEAACMSIKARADWVLVNGKWCRREGITRRG